MTAFAITAAVHSDGGSSALGKFTDFFASK